MSHAAHGRPEAAQKTALAADRLGFTNEAGHDVSPGSIVKSFAEGSHRAPAEGDVALAVGSGEDGHRIPAKLGWGSLKRGGGVQREGGEFGFHLLMGEC